jgi:hypothetical protein
MAGHLPETKPSSNKFSSGESAQEQVADGLTDFESDSCKQGFNGALSLGTYAHASCAVEKGESASLANGPQAEEQFCHSEQSRFLG